MHKIVYSTSYNNCKIVHSTMYINSTYKTCTVVTFIDYFSLSMETRRDDPEYLFFNNVRQSLRAKGLQIVVLTLHS